MRFEDYHWFYGNGSLFAIIFTLLLLGGLAYLLVHIFYKYKNGYNYYATRQGKCPNCHIPVEATYIRCPECHHKLKTNCPSCGMVVKTDWDICPYCEKELLKNK